jgi:hypothetical protein
MRRTMLMLVIMGTTVALAAGVALAQATTETIEDKQTIEFGLDENPCIGEPVHFSATLHSVFHITQDAAGGFHVATEFNLANVEGTGAVSGGQYRAPTVVHSTFHSNSGGFPIIVTETSEANIIGEGQLPDFTSHFLVHLTINENGTVTAEVLRVREECRGGSQ